MMGEQERDERFDDANASLFFLWFCKKVAIDAPQE
jgi:hypothetical protein